MFWGESLGAVGWGLRESSISPGGRKCDEREGKVTPTGMARC